MLDILSIYLAWVRGWLCAVHFFYSCDYYLLPTVYDLVMAYGFTGLVIHILMHWDRIGLYGWDTVRGFGFYLV